MIKLIITNLSFWNCWRSRLDSIGVCDSKSKPTPTPTANVEDKRRKNKGSDCIDKLVE
jgi:hypothetical protein